MGGLSFVAITALFINLSGRSKKDKGHASCCLSFCFLMSQLKSLMHVLTSVTTETQKSLQLIFQCAENESILRSFYN